MESQRVILGVKDQKRSLKGRLDIQFSIRVTVIVQSRCASIETKKIGNLLLSHFLRFRPIRPNFDSSYSFFHFLRVFHVLHLNCFLADMPKAKRNNPVSRFHGQNLAVPTKSRTEHINLLDLKSSICVRLSARISCSYARVISTV